MRNNSSGGEEDPVDPKECPTHRLVGKQAFSIEEARFLLDKAAPYLCEVCRQFFQRLVLADGILREDSEVNERSDPQFTAGSQLDGGAAMEQQRITDSERMERIFARLYEKAMTPDKLDQPLLGPPGFVCREFADDLRELPPGLYMRVEEYAWILEDAVSTGKFGR